MDTYQIRTMISFLLAGMIFVLLTILPLPGNEVSYIADPTLHQGIRQLVWLVSFAGVLIYFLRQSDDNLIGTFMCAIMGPVTILTLILMRISFKLFPVKRTGDR